jgi:ParB-like chromosome segregation protein Spo0J
MTGESSQIVEKVRAALACAKDLPLDELVAVLNEIRRAIQHASPFKDEPVDLVTWVRADCLTGNDYNPNTVAPPEMELLRHSIRSDGYTQPIVAFEKDGKFEVVDGFHRHRVGKETPDIQARLSGYLPVVVINQSRDGKSDRMASTIRHNRARGKHQVDAMSDIVIELFRRGWSNDQIGNELGMQEDEVLRLKQVSGLADLFKDAEFSKSWDWIPE